MSYHLDIIFVFYLFCSVCRNAIMDFPVSCFGGKVSAENIIVNVIEMNTPRDGQFLHSLKVILYGRSLIHNAFCFGFN